MNSKISVYRILVPVILAIFLVSSLADAFDQERLVSLSTIQLSSYTPDDDNSLDKKKNSCALLQNVLFCGPSQVLNHESLIHPSFIISYITFPCFLRAPPGSSRS